MPYLLQAIYPFFTFGQYARLMTVSRNTEDTGALAETVTKSKEC
jgi:hypothetical protein